MKNPRGVDIEIRRQNNLNFY